MRGKHDLNPIFFGLSQLILPFALIHGVQPNARGNWIFFHSNIHPIHLFCVLLRVR